MGLYGSYWSPKGALKVEFPDFLFFRFSSVLRLKPFEMTLKVVLEVLLDVPEVLPEVLDLSWGRFSFIFGVFWKLKTLAAPTAP